MKMMCNIFSEGLSKQDVEVRMERVATLQCLMQVHDMKGHLVHEHMCRNQDIGINNAYISDFIMDNLCLWFNQTHRQGIVDEFVFEISPVGCKEFFHRICRKEANAFGSFEFTARRNQVIDFDQCDWTDAFGTEEPCVSVITLKTRMLRLGLFPRAAGFLAHEIFGHPMSTRQSVSSLQKRQTKFPQELSVIDNPGGEIRYGSYERTADGLSWRRVCCVNHGIVEESIEGNVVPSYGGRRENETFCMEPRMSNLEVVADRYLDFPKVDLCLYDCICGQEPTENNRKAHITGLVPKLMIAGRMKSNVQVECTFRVDNLTRNFAGAFGHSCERPIDCFQHKSGWVRTSVTSPGFIFDIPVEDVKVISD